MPSPNQRPQVVNLYYENPSFDRARELTSRNMAPRKLFVFVFLITLQYFASARYVSVTFNIIYYIVIILITLISPALN